MSLKRLGRALGSGFFAAALYVGVVLVFSNGLASRWLEVAAIGFGFAALAWWRGGKAVSAGSPSDAH